MGDPTQEELYTVCAMALRYLALKNELKQIGEKL